LIFFCTIVWETFTRAPVPDLATTAFLGFSLISAIIILPWLLISAVVLSLAVGLLLMFRRSAPVPVAGTIAEPVDVLAFHVAGPGLRVPRDDGHRLHGIAGSYSTRSRAGLTGNQTAQVVADEQPGATMPTERLSMRRIRDLLRLKHAQGFGERAIALSLGLGKGTVGGYLARLRQAGLSWRSYCRIRICS